MGRHPAWTKLAAVMAVDDPLVMFNRRAVHGTAMLTKPVDTRADASELNQTAFELMKVELPE
jgi:hypothetical protein